MHVMKQYPPECLTYKNLAKFNLYFAQSPKYTFSQVEPGLDISPGFS